MRRRLFSIILSVLLVLAVFTSCEGEKLPSGFVTSPSLKGKVALPEGATVSPGDFYVQVIDTETEKVVYNDAVKEDGSFVVSNLDATRKYNVLLTTDPPYSSFKAVKSGYGGWLQDATASIGAANDVGSIKTKPLGTITGKAELSGETEHYDITVYIPGTSYDARTDKDGSFTISNVPQGTYRLRYTSDGYLARMKENVVLRSDDDITSPVASAGTTTLVRNEGTVTGYAFLSGAKEHTGINIKFEDKEGSGFEASTSSNGSYSVKLKPGLYNAIVSYPGYKPETYSGINVVAANTTVLDEFSLVANAGSIIGTLIDKDGHPLSGVNVLVRDGEGEHSYSSLSSLDGTYLVSGVLPGTYDVTFNGSAYATVIIRDVVVGMSTRMDLGSTTLQLGTGSLSGRVILEGELDASGVTVLAVLDSDSSVRHSTVTALDGTYSSTGLKPGQYTLQISRADFVTDNSVTLEVVKGQNTAASLVELKSTSSRVSGKVSLEETTDYSGATVLLKKTDNSIQYTQTSDMNGDYVFARVVPGTYTLTVGKSGYVSRTVSDIVVSPASEKTLDLVSILVGTRSVTGSVDLELTENEAGALITASSLETPSLVYTAISNSRGSFTLAGMRPGQYTVTISAANYSSVTLETISILEGSTMDIGKTELPIARGFITGVAILEGRASSAGIKAELMKGSDVYDTVYTDASGAYVFSVPQGNYSGVRLSAEDFRSESRAQSIALIANDYVAIEGRTLTMIATHVPEVKGRVTVTGLLSQDYSGTTISLEELPEFTVETDEDGYWSFSKVPVGNYTLRMERENTRLVTVKFSLTAAASRTIETIALEPNAASIEGHVTLTGLSDYSGITVRATAEGAVELRTTTNAAGYFYIGNVITTKEYTAHFEKNGWNSVERRVSGLESLSLNDITSSNPISLTDTTVPVINSMTVIAGNSEVEGRRLNVYLNVEEAGSGCRRVYVNTTDDFAGVEPIAYASPFSCFVEDTAGDYTLYVKVEDTSGNLSSVYSSPFKVSDYRTVVSGVLVDNEDGINDGVITWTKAKSPYYVTSNILVEEGKTLIVEPGVNIQFSGNYYMQVDGTLLVNGTESENVYFYGVGSGWSGIGMSSDESVIQYAQISNLNRGIGGKGCLYHCIIQGGSVLGENSSMGAFQGRVYNSSFQGTIYAQSSYFGNCEIEGYASFYGTVVSGCRFHSGAYIDGIAENCEFFNQSVTICDEAMYCSFSNCFVLSGYRENQAKLLGNNFYSCTFSDVDFGIVRGCNFFNLAKLSTKCEKTRVASMDFTGNYWGPDYTAELNTYGTGSNLSFIHDYYDDFALAKFDLSGYATEAFADAGHKGDSYYSSEESTVQYQIGDRGPAGGWVFYDKGFYSEGWRYLEAAPTDLGSYKFCYYQRNDNAPREAIYTMQTVGSGRMNTNLLSMLMLDHAYSESDSNAKSNDFAARMCFDYEVNGYDDWFLPSKDELNLMYINLKANGIGSFENFNYWSSSMSDYYGNIWTQYFGNGSLCVSTGAVIQNKVRAVRAF